MISTFPRTTAPWLKIELAPQVTVSKLVVMVAALISLYIDQSFGGAYSSIVTYAGGTLGASSDEISWTSVTYNAGYYTMLLFSPWLIRRFSRRAVFGGGHFLFAVFSVYLALATWLNGFIVVRGLQGFAQGTFFVSSVATVLTLFPRKYSSYAFSIFSVTSLSGAATGPFIGGWFIDHGFWRDTFWLYAMMALFSSGIIFLLLEAPGPDATTKSDWTGVGIVFIAFLSFNYITAFGERRDWFSDTAIVLFSIACFIAFAAFVTREVELGPSGFINLRLFTIRNLAIGSILGFGLGAPLFGGNSFLQYAESSLHFPPSTAGALLTLRILAIVFVAPVAVTLVNADIVNVKIPVVLGFFLVPLSYALLDYTTTSHSGFWDFGVPLIISGAGFAMLFSPIANVTIRALPQQFTEQGIAIFKLVLVLGGSIASTALNVLYDHDTDAYLSLLAGRATQKTLEATGALGVSREAYAQMISGQASVLAYADSSKWIAVSALALLPLVGFLKSPKKS